MGLAHAIHLLSLGVHVLVLIQVARTVPALTRMSHSLLRYTVTIFLMLTTAMALSFSLIQIIWVITEPVSVLVDPVDLIWLVFDWTNATAYLLFVGAIRAYLDSLSEQ
jgi:hypothetical protein